MLLRPDSPGKKKTEFTQLCANGKCTTKRSIQREKLMGEGLRRISAKGCPTEIRMSLDLSSRFSLTYSKGYNTMSKKNGLFSASLKIIFVIV